MSAPRALQVQDSTLYGEAAEGGAIVDGAQAHKPGGMRVTPEVTLFVGGAVVSAVLIAVMLVFWWKASKQESAAEKERQKNRNEHRRRADVSAGGDA